MVLIVLNENIGVMQIYRYHSICQADRIGTLGKLT